MQLIDLKESKGIINKNEFRIVGISRSGNHAIINWIINQLDGQFCFLNCVEPKHNPFFTARPFNSAGESFQTNICDFNINAERDGNFSKKDFLLYNYEDCFLGMLNHQLFKKSRARWVGESSFKKDILIIRDVFNLFASRIKANLIVGHQTHYGVNPISTLALKRIYKQHAKEFLGEKKNLQDKVLINYNQWFSDNEYRRSIAEKLELPFTDKGLEEVINCAGGSSFDGMRFSGNANKMNLNNRWKEYASEDFFWDLFDEELVKLNSKIFGEIEPVKYWKEVINPESSLSVVPA
jgi:hypothetical protein